MESENVSKKERRRWLGGESEGITNLAKQETCKKITSIKKWGHTEMKKWRPHLSKWGNASARIVKYEYHVLQSFCKNYDSLLDVYLKTFINNSLEQINKSLVSQIIFHIGTFIFCMTFRH